MYKVGDRVRIIDLDWSDADMGMILYDTGTVVVVQGDGTIGVDWDNLTTGHCMSAERLHPDFPCRPDHGRFVCEDQVVLEKFYSCPNCKAEVMPDMLGLCPNCTWVLR